MKAGGVAGASRDEQVVARAMEQLRQQGYSSVTTYSPLGSEQLLESQPAPPSPIRFYTLTGGILGLSAGLALTAGTSFASPLLTGGKPIVSLPAFLVVCFEMTMLLAGLFTFAAFVLYGSVLRRPDGAGGYLTKFSVDCFGIFVRCDASQTEEVCQLLLNAGLEEVSVAEG